MGRDRRDEQRVEHFTKMMRHMMEEPAWAALPSSAQALYSWIKLEWRGPKNNNNGKIRLSCRQAANRMGVSRNTANRAFQTLLAKGFLIVTEPAHLGVGGKAKSPAYEITELGCVTGTDHGGKRLYKNWTRNADFPVPKAKANNRKGLNGKSKARRQNEDSTVINLTTVKKITSPK